MDLVEEYPEDEIEVLIIDTIDTDEIIGQDPFSDAEREPNGNTILHLYRSGQLIKKLNKLAAAGKYKRSENKPIQKKLGICGPKSKSDQNKLLKIQDIKRCSCRFKCHNQVNVSMQNVLLRDFLKIESKYMKQCFLSSLIVTKNVARRRVKDENSKRKQKSHSRVYYLPLGNGEKARVCLRFFCDVFQISSSIPSTIVKNRTTTGALARQTRKVGGDKCAENEANKNKSLLSNIVLPKPAVVTELCPCKFKCHLKIGKNRQVMLFRDFCNLKQDEMQKAFISSLLVVRPVARRKENPVSEKQRKRSCACFLPVYNGEKARVCQKFFCSVFQIHPGIINTIVKHRTSTGALLLKNKSVHSKKTKRRLNTPKAKEFQPINICNCKYKCHYQVKEDFQKNIHDEYRNLQTQLDRETWLSNFISEKESTVTGNMESDSIGEIKRTRRAYHLPIDDGKIAVVCQKFFSNIVDVSHKTISAAILK